MNIIHQTPTLQSTASTGLKKFWQGQVLTDGTNFYTRSVSWQETKGGGTSKPLESVPSRIEGKNQGRANATTPEQQAMAECKSDEQRKRDKGYVEEGQVCEVLPLPMLAHEFGKRGGDIVYPCFVQPKHDGCRCLYDGKQFWSRGGKVFDPQVTAHLHFDTQGHIIDGELILPAEAGGFQDTMKAVKKFRPELSPKLQFHAFDIVDAEKPFTERTDRLAYLHEAPEIDPAKILFVPTIHCANLEMVKYFHAQFMTAGYEGTIIRNGASLYAINQRSSGLQKFKDFEDAEFKIVGAAEGTGSDEGCVIFVCLTPEGKLFNVRPRGTVAQRREMFALRDTYIGNRVLTVRFQGKSDDGIPRFPVGISIRDFELQGGDV